MNRQTFPIWASIFTLISLLILCSLGFWQLQRLEWKQALLTEIDAEYAKDPHRHPLTSKDFTDKHQSWLIRRGTIVGRYLHGKELAIAPRTYEGKPGYHIITPFRLEDGGYVMVNRGWVPEDKKAPTSRPQEASKPLTVTLTGYFRIPGRNNIFVPQNDIEKDQWYRLDLASMAAAREITELTIYRIFMLETMPDGQSYPISIAKQWRPPNNHRQYALFWFAMAGVLCVIYYLRFFMKNNKSDKTSS